MDNKRSAIILTILIALASVALCFAQPITPSELAWPHRHVAAVPVKTFWLMADAGVYHDLGVTLALNGQTVPQWNDQSASGYNVTNLTGVGANQPTFATGQLNGLPTVKFGGSAFLNNSTRAVTQPVTFIVVIKFNNGPNVLDQLFIKGLAGSPVLGFGRTKSGTNACIFSGGPAVTDSYLTNGGFRLITFVANGASSVIRVDGVQTMTGDSGSGVMNQFFIGSDGSTFDVAEVIKYENAVPSNAGILADEAYLRSKWGL